MKITIKNNQIKSFKEKPQKLLKQLWFFITNQNFFKYIKNDKSILEKTFRKAASKTFAFKHKGFLEIWILLRDRQVLEKFIKKIN